MPRAARRRDARKRATSQGVRGGGVPMRGGGVKHEPHAGSEREVTPRILDAVGPLQKNRAMLPGSRARRVLLALALAAAPAAAAAEAPVVYKWIDESGVAHYTTDRDRVPSSLRDRVLPRSAPPATRATPESWSAMDAPPSADADAESTAVSAPGDFAEEPAAATQSGSAEEPTPAPLGTQLATRPPAPGAAGELDARIAELERQIVQDEESLEALLSDASLHGGTPLPERGDFREIAHRLPKLQADLRALRDERARLESR